MGRQIFENKIDPAIKRAQKYLGSPYKTLRATEAHIRNLEYLASQAIQVRGMLQRALLGSRRYSKQIKEINERIDLIADLLTQLQDLLEYQMREAEKAYQRSVLRGAEVFGGRVKRRNNRGPKKMRKSRN